MKKNILLVSLFVAMLSINVAPVFANTLNETTVVGEKTKGTKTTNNEGRSKYLEKANVIKAQIDEIQKEIDTYKTYNESVKEAYTKISKEYKQNKESSISKENLDKAKELRKTIANKNESEKTVREENAVKNLVKDGNYEEAINKLNTILTNKKAQLEFHKNANTIWKQIEELIK